LVNVADHARAVVGSCSLSVVGGAVLTFAVATAQIENVRAGRYLRIDVHGGADDDSVISADPRGGGLQDKRGGVETTLNGVARTTRPDCTTDEGAKPRRGAA